MSVHSASTGSLAVRPGGPRRWWTLAVLACLQFMLVLDATVVNIALPSIKIDLGFSQANLAWVVDAYVLVAGGFLLLGGRLADVFGRRRVFLGGAAAFAIGSLLSGAAQDQAMLISSRAFQGLGEALAGPAALSIIAVTFNDPKERTTALSIWGGLAGLGGTVGVVLSGAIIDLANWRWIFYINLPVAIAVLALAPRLIGNDRRHGGPRFDFFGAVAATGGITALVYALLEANHNGWTSATTVVFFAAGGVLLAAFVGIETIVRAPLVPLSFFRTGRQNAASGLMVFVASALYGMFFLLTLYMQLVLRWSPMHTAVGYLAFGLGMLAGIGAASQLAVRTGTRPLIVVGMAVTAGGMALFTRLPVPLHYWTGMLPAMLLVSFGMGLSFVAITMTAVSGAGEADAGLASGMVTTAQQVGGALGLAVLVSVATARTSSRLASGSSRVVAELAGTHLALGVGAVLLALGAVLAAIVVPRSVHGTVPPPTPVHLPVDDERVRELVA